MKKLLFYLNLFLIFILQFISEVVIPLPSILFALLCVTAFLLVGPSHIMGLYLYLILLSSGGVLYLVNMLFFISIIIYFRNEIKFDITLIFIFGIIFIESIHVLVNNSLGIEESIIKLFGFSACLLLFGFIRSLSKVIDIKATLNFLIYGLLGFTIITTGIYLFKYGIGNYFTEIRRFGFVPYKTEEGIGGLIINPNTLGKYCAFVIASILTLNTFGKIKLNIWYIFVLAMVAIVGLLTLSRTFLLVVALVMIIYLFTNVLGNKSVLSLFAFIIVISIFCIILYSNQSLYDSLYHRIFETDDISGSRLLIYSQYAAILFSHVSIFLFGVGMQNYVEKFSRLDTLISQSTHNVLLEVLSSWGIVGLLIIVILFSLIIVQSKVTNLKISKRIIILLPFFVVIISALFGQFFISYYHTFSIAIFSLVILYSDGVVKHD